MPIETPPVTDPFIAAVKSDGWSNNHLVDPASGAAKYPSAASGAWTVQATGLLISATTRRLLSGASGANSDGSFTVGGTTYWLSVQSGWAVEVPA